MAEVVEVRGVPLEVHRLLGASSKSPVVFLHEGLGSVSMWRGWPRALCAATGRAGIVFSRRGYGGSGGIPDVRGAGRHKPDYMHEEALQVLPELLGRLGVSAPVLLGHSDGGTIALIHSARHSVSACVVMAPHVVVEDVSVRAIEQARKAFEEGDLRDRLKRYHADVDCAFWQWNDIWLDPAFRAFDIRAQTRSIAAPILAIQGERDPYGTLRQIEEIGPTKGVLERAVIADCGHSPHRDQPEAVTACICAFLADVP